MGHDRENPPPEGLSLTGRNPERSRELGASELTERLISALRSGQRLEPAQREALLHELSVDSLSGVEAPADSVHGERGAPVQSNADLEDGVELREEPTQSGTWQRKKYMSNDDSSGFDNNLELLGGKFPIRVRLTTDGQVDTSISAEEFNTVIGRWEAVGLNNPKHQQIIDAARRELEVGRVPARKA